jgi:hypothetical protein
MLNSSEMVLLGIALLMAIVAMAPNALWHGLTHWLSDAFFAHEIDEWERDHEGR